MKEEIYIGFSTSSGLVSLLIRLFEWSKYSHVYVRIPSESLQRDLVYQASGTKVNFDGWIQFQAHNKIVKEYALDITPETKTKTLQTAIDHLGIRYGFVQLLGMMWIRFGRLLGKKFKNPFPSGKSAYICSELVAEVLKELGYNIQGDQDSIDPKAVDKFLMEHLDDRTS